VYGDEDGREVYGSEYSLGAVRVGSNSTSEAPQVKEGRVVPREVPIEEAGNESPKSEGSRISGGEAMLALVENDMVNLVFGITSRWSPTPKVEFLHSDLDGSPIVEAWFSDQLEE